MPQDMVAVPFGGHVRFLAVASPVHLERHDTPLVPDDLRRHACVRHRLPSGKLYRWEVEKRGQEMALEVAGPLTLDDNRLMVSAAADGLGIAFVPNVFARAGVAAGRLVPVPDDRCPAYSGFCLDHPGHRHVPTALRAVIDVLKHQASANGAGRGF